MNVFLFFLNLLLLMLFGVASTGACAQEMPWHLGSLNASASAPAAINTVGVKPGPYEVTVAVIDSGVLATHPSLKGRLLPGYDMISSGGNLRGSRSSNVSPDPRESKCGDRVTSATVRNHGTEVSSLIAGNGTGGVRGVNPNTKILPIRLFSACQMSRSDLLDALAWAAGMPVSGVPSNPNPAQVINLSFAGGKASCGADLQQLLNRISEKKIFVVAAVGNTFGAKLAEPANCEGVISVGAVDAENNVESYSAIDPRTVVYAPGGGRPLRNESPWRTNKLQVASYDVNLVGSETPVSEARGMGTSYAAPLVSGFISLLLSNRPDLTPAEFLNKLSQHARPVNPTERCSECRPKGLVMSTAYLQ